MKNFGKIRPIFGFTTNSPFKRYKFLSVLEFITKVLLTVFQSVHPFGCFKRISGFVRMGYMGYEVFGCLLVENINSEV